MYASSLRRFSLIIALTGLLILLAAGWVVTRKKLDQYSANYTRNVLTGMLAAADSSLENWQSGHIRTARFWSQQNELLALSAGLSKQAVNPQALLKAPEQGAIRRLLQPLLDYQNYDGYFLIAPDGTSLASSRDSNVGSLNLIKKDFPERFAKLYSGKQHFSPPQWSDVPLNGGTKSKAPPETAPSDYSMFVTFPMGVAEDPVALLALRIRPERRFFGIFQSRGFGQSGRIFAFDPRGRLMTETNSPAQNRRYMFNPLIEPDSGKLLWPIRQHLSQGESFNLKGYRSFDHAEVVGTWHWLPQLNLGIAAEINVSEIYALRQQFRLLIDILFGLIILLFLFLCYFSLRLLRQNAQFAQSKLVQAENRAQVYLDASASLFIICRSDGQIIDLNQWGLKWLGYQLRDLQETAVVELIQAQDQPAFVAWLASHKANESRVFHLESKDSTSIPFQLRFSSLPDSQDFLIAGHDIRHLMAIQTQLVDSQESLKLAKEQAEQANQAKSQFLANMSHEIRTPLHAVMGLGHLLEKTKLNATQKDYTSKIKTASENLLGIINNILDFSKIEANMVELEHVSFELENVFHHLSSVLAVKTAYKDVELIFNIAADLPRSFIGDPLRLEQILINLGSNAIKFTPAGTVTIRVSQTDRTPAGCHLLFEVQDTGTGIAPEKQQGLFEAFTQADTSTTRQFGGTGLGLSIAHQMVRLMGGDLRFQSEPGQGSCFFFTIPLPLAPKDNQAQTPRHLANLRVLIIDDQPILLEILANYLEHLGMNVSTAESGQEALTVCESIQAQGQRLDLVLIDIQMPEWNGFQTLEQLEPYFEAHRPTVIMMTASKDPNVRSRLAAHQVNSLLQKPITQSSLYNHLLDYLKTGALQLHSTETVLSRDDRLDLNGIKGARILVVEDNQINQQILVELLRSEGLVIDLANHGQQALDRLVSEQEHYDMVFMDLQMPIMDGYEATRRIRELQQFASLPIVAMTADAVAGVKDKVLEVGMNDYLTKPIQLDLLNQALNKWIKTKSQGDQAAEIETRSVADIAQLDFQSLEILDTMQSLDVDSALASAANNPRLVIKLLLRFYRQYAGFVAEIEQPFEDLEARQQSLHGFKGVAVNLGLQALFQAADRLESTRPEKGSQQLEADLKQAWLQFERDIESIEQWKANMDIDQVAKKRQLLNHLHRLRTKVETFDIEAIQELESIIARSPDYADALQKVCAPLQKFDYIETEAALAHLISTLSD